MEYLVTHTTEYIYDGAISLCHNVARLIPRSTPSQSCKKTRIVISPEPDVFSEYEDFFGNKVLYFAIQQEHRKLKVTVSSNIVKQSVRKLETELLQQIGWEQVQAQMHEPTPEMLDAKQYIAETAMTAFSPAIFEYASKSFVKAASMFDATLDLMQRIFRDFEFKPGFTTISTPVEEVMKIKKGVCQDFAHLAISCIRSIGLPARYVSGYIETLAPEGKEKLVGADASHAWFAIYIPTVGWIDFDPTNNVIPSERHISIGWGRDYADVTPLKGIVLSSGKHELSVSVDVRRTP
jgi:transglutaminase-like putative cysteine protease